MKTYYVVAWSTESKPFPNLVDAIAETPEEAEAFRAIKQRNSSLTYFVCELHAPDPLSTVSEQLNNFVATQEVSHAE